VDDAVVMYDHDNRRPRGFGFVTFGSVRGAPAGGPQPAPARRLGARALTACGAQDGAVNALLSAGTMQTLHDKPIEIKHAVPPEQIQQQPGRAPGAGRGRGAPYAAGNGYYGAPAVRPGAYGAAQGDAPYQEALNGHAYGGMAGLAGGGGAAGLGPGLAGNGLPGGGLGAPRPGELGYGAGAAAGAVSQAAVAGGLANGGGLGAYGAGAGGLLDGRTIAGLPSLGGMGAGPSGFSMGSLQGALPPAHPHDGLDAVQYAGAYGDMHASNGGAGAHAGAHASSQAMPGPYGVLPALAGGGGFGGYGGGGELGGAAGAPPPVPDYLGGLPERVGGGEFGGDAGAAFLRGEPGGAGGGLGHELAPHAPSAYGDSFHRDPSLPPSTQPW